MRIIEILRHRYGGKWKYEYPSKWVGESFDIQAFSCLVSTTPNGYDSATTRYYRSDNNEEVILPRTGRLEPI